MNHIIQKHFPDGSPNYYEEKIWACLLMFKIVTNDDFSNYFDGDKGMLIKVADRPKFHMIIENNSDFWKEGSPIQIAYDDTINGGVRQIIPSIRCVSTQKIQIRYKPELSTIPMIFIDDKSICISEVERLAINEGFGDAGEFYRFYNKSFTGKIIHWTSLRYAE